MHGAGDRGHRRAGALSRASGRGPVPGDGLQGRIRGRAAACRRVLRAGVLPHVAAVDHPHRPGTGRRNKIAIPGWLALPLFRVLRKGKVLRGTALDPFGYQAERKAERALIEQYIADLHDVLAELRPETMATAVSLASLPDTIPGLRTGERQRTHQGRGSAGGSAGRFAGDTGCRDGGGIDRQRVTIPIHHMNRPPVSMS